MAGGARRRGVAFFAGRDAFKSADLEWMIGVVPVVLGLVTGILLRALLRYRRLVSAT